MIDNIFDKLDFFDHIFFHYSNLFNVYTYSKSHDINNVASVTVYFLNL